MLPQANGVLTVDAEMRRNCRFNVDSWLSEALPDERDCKSPDFRGACDCREAARLAEAALRRRCGKQKNLAPKVGRVTEEREREEERETAREQGGGVAAAACRKSTNRTSHASDESDAEQEQPKKS